MNDTQKIILSAEYILQFKSQHNECTEQLRKLIDECFPKRTLKNKPQQLKRKPFAKKKEQRIEERPQLFKKQQEDAFATNLMQMLNKLSEKNYSILLEDFKKQTEVITPHNMYSFCKTIIDKSCAEPVFTSLYVRLCSDMQSSFNLALEKNHCEQLHLGDDEALEEIKTLKRAFIDSCQEEFERKSYCSHWQQLDAEEQAFKQRKRRVGFAILLGELFNQQVINGQVLKHIVQSLFEERAHVDENIKTIAKEQLEHEYSLVIEPLCAIVSSAGRKWDEKASLVVQKIVQKLKEWKSDKSLPVRLRFLVADCVDLAARKWQKK